MWAGPRIGRCDETVVDRRMGGESLRRIPPSAVVSCSSLPFGSRSSTPDPRAGESGAGWRVTDTAGSEGSHSWSERARAARRFTVSLYVDPLGAAYRAYNVRSFPTLFRLDATARAKETFTG